MNDHGVFSAHDYSRRVRGLIERNRHVQARDELAEALGQYPDDSDLLYHAALLDYLTGQPDAARSALLRVLSREPDHYAGRSLLATLYQESGELPAAETVLIDLLRDYPESGHHYARYAMLMYRTRHLDKAKALAHEALRLDPDDELALIACMMGDLIDGRKGAEQERLAALMSRHPESAGTAHMLITHLVHRGKYRAAKRIAIELLKLNPGSREILGLVVELDALSHWSMLPLWPFNRWGWAASVVLWVTMVAVFSGAGKIAPHILGPLNIFLIGYCAYSWIFPSLLKRWLKRRAGI
ncbi:tetratricopeptide repeat protein [Massilia sp. CCM 8733]|uniref:Tetratricopeptide repeat protein n=1 Tax=Massilia mucilaginosa TaxID=2609282 RepID=A0ABX0NM11_9BURK|nr:tetratricopeptide repeat protein [Massilia mucilaginosa]NHZ87862.1 tetratricopeptide repeat protein [Massilia mucilaginosa]